MKSRRRENKRTGLTVLAGIFVILFGCILGVTLNVRALLVSTIGSAGIDTAVSHRMMDAVFEELGAGDTDALLDIQQRMENDPQIRKITEKLLDEMTSSLAEHREFQDVDITPEIEAVADDIKSYAGSLGINLGDAQAEILKNSLLDKKDEIEDAVNYQAENVSSYLSAPSGLGGYAVAAYNVLDSVWLKAVSAALLAGFAALTIVFARRARRALAFLGGEFILVAAFFLLVAGPAGNALMMALSNRYLGRTMMLDTGSLNMTGFIFLALGAVMLIVSLIIYLVQRNTASDAKQDMPRPRRR